MTGPIVEPVVIPKVWGEERVLVNREHCGKRMILKAGFRCSMHWHARKDETFLVLSGRVKVEIGPEGFASRFTTRNGRIVGIDLAGMLRYCRTVTLKPGDVLDVPPWTPHRFTGLEDSEFAEFSTHDDPEDSYRLSQSGPVPADSSTSEVAGAREPAEPER